MTHIVKAAHAADFLAFVPHLLGFQPRDSVVLVAFRGNRTCCALRFDTPAGESDVVLKRVATTIIGMLSKVDGVDAVVPVVYTEAPLGDEPPAIEFMRVLIDRCRYSGFLVRDALFVAKDGWGPYDEEPVGSRGVVGSTPARRSLDEIEQSALPSLIPEGMSSPLESPLRGAELPQVDLATTERVARLIRDMDGAVRNGLSVFDEMLLDLPEFLEGVIDTAPAELPDWVAAAVIVLVQSGATRDVALLQWAFDITMGDLVLDDIEAAYGSGDDHAEDDAHAAAAFAAGGVGERTRHLSEIMLGRGDRPDRDRLDRGAEISLALAARSPRRLRVPLLVMAAWYRWADGRSSVATALLRSAHEIDPDYGLAVILSTLMINGVMAEWVFQDPHPADSDGSDARDGGEHARSSVQDDLNAEDARGRPGWRIEEILGS